MKKLTLILLTLTALALGGCNPDSASTVGNVKEITVLNGKFKIEESEYISGIFIANHVGVITDTQTGVKYLLVNTDDGLTITPLLTKAP